MKTTILCLGILAAVICSEAQTVNILSVTTLPASLTDTQHTKAVVTSRFTSGGCPVVGSSSSIMGDSVLLGIAYNVGMLAYICTTTDTFDLGILPCTINKLHVLATMSGAASGTDDFTLPLNISCLAAGVVSLGNETKIAIFPNPASKELTIKINGGKFSRAKFSVLNLLGETMFTSIEFSNENTTVKRIDVSTFAKGVYLVKVETTTGITVSRFIKD